MSKKLNPATLNPLMLKPESYDILEMLRVMDRHLEAREFERKFNDLPEPATKSELPQAAAAPRPPKLATLQLKGRKIIRRVMGAKRFAFTAKAMLHKNDRYIKGKVINISKSGVFIEADRALFQENETVRLYIRPQGGKKSYKVIATVMRFNDDARYPRGYGLKFVSL